MNTATNDRQAARAAEIEARLHELSSERAPIEQEVDLLGDEIEKLAREVCARDWVLTGQRPRGAVSDGTLTATQEHRRELAAQRVAYKRALAEMRKELRQIDGAATTLRNELHAIQRAMVTPESLATEIAQAGEVLAVLEGERIKLSDVLGAALQQQAQLEADIAAEPEAVAQLEQARADTYLTPNDGALAAAVDHAEAAAAMAREKAAGARAAADRVALKVNSARDALAAHDAKAAQQSATVQALKQRRAVLVARQAIHAAATVLRNALADLLAADEREGLSLAHSWAGEGLRVPDADGEPRLASWLQGTLTPRTGAERRAALLAALTA